ncbi:hypothetical protein WA026_019284 [Henosepilachna vigintioctopunctata]|uniref:Uncharacterized protein n=1 Tax=Henosepilachna vigintioctopunctata TaxID=420089 RepID=A0AAW1UAH0_9CUCU
MLSSPTNLNQIIPASPSNINQLLPFQNSNMSPPSINQFIYSPLSLNQIIPSPENKYESNVTISFSQFEFRNKFSELESSNTVPSIQLESYIISDVKSSSHGCISTKCESSGAFTWLQ